MYGEDEATGLMSPFKIYHQFPLEDICACSGADFVGAQQQFDLIVASWTMLHLADPMGTLVQLYTFLAPQGILLANFCYAHISDGDKANVERMFSSISNMYDLWYGEEETICIRKNGLQRLNLPINYTEETVAHVWQTIQPQYCVTHYEFTARECTSNEETEKAGPGTEHAPLNLSEFLRL